MTGRSDNQLIPTGSANLNPPTWPSTPATSRFEAELQPATAKAGTAELLACLTLVAPSGMTAEDRQAWVAVARATLAGIPADLLQRGCERVRKTCRFASEIVPTILGEVEPTWKWRQRSLAEERERIRARETPKLPDPEYVSAEEIQKLIKQIAA